jgi:hypothetical protein
MTLLFTIKFDGLVALLFNYFFLSENDKGHNRRPEK